MDAAALDFQFGTAGFVKTDFGGDDSAFSFVQQNDDKIVVVGWSGASGNSDVAVARYNPNGGLDPTFSGDGKVLTPVGAFKDEARSVAIQKDGKILVAGNTAASNGSTDVFILRYNPDGTLDTSFDGDGKRILALSTGNDGASSIVALSNGKIVVAGYKGNGTNTDWAVVRLNSNGSYDTSFDGDGKAILSLGNGDDKAYGLSARSDGSIIVAGNTHNGNDYSIAVAKFLSNGKLDGNFGTSGRIITSANSTDTGKYGFAVQADGKLLVASSTGGSDARNVEILRYTSVGLLDGSFDGDGRVQTAIGTGDEVGYSIAVQPNGKILVSGYDDETGKKADLLLLRYNSNGSLDSSFSGDGILRAAPTTFNDVGYQVGIQRDGRILVAGYTKPSDVGNFFLARYLGDPPTLSGESGDQLTVNSAAIWPLSSISVINPYRETLTLQLVIHNALQRGDFDSPTVSGWTRFADGNDVTYVRSVVGDSSGSLATSTLRALKFLPRVISSGSVSTHFTVTINDSAGTTITNDDEISVLNQFHNDPPVLVMGGSHDYLLNGTTVLLDASARLTDPDGGNLSGGRLRVWVSTGAKSTDRLEIGGGFAVNGSDVIRNGNVIGTLNANGGVGLTDLIVSFNSAATPAIAQELLRSIRYRTAGESVAVDRIVSVSVSDGDGGTSATRSVSIDLSDVRTESFDQNPGWAIQGSGVAGNSFGYSSTSNAGGGIGEIGGKFTRSSVFRYVGDTALESTLSLNNVLRASGRIDATAFNNPDIGRNIMIGHFLNIEGTTGSSNKIGIGFNNTGSELSWTILVATSDGSHDGDVVAPGSSFPSNQDRYFEYTYDPNGGVFGFGRLIGRIYNSVSSETKILDVPGEFRAIGASFNSFGMSASFTGLNPDDLNQNATIYIDDVSYTASAIFPSSTSSLRTTDSAPTLSLSGTVGYARGSAGIAIAPGAQVTALDSSGFAGGRLTVEVATGFDPSNTLAIGGSFTLAGTDVRLDGVSIGTLNVGGGIGTTKLEVTLKSTASVSIVKQLVQSIRFKTTASAPTGNRVISFGLIDGDGGVSNTATKTVKVSA